MVHKNSRYWTNVISLISSIVFIVISVITILWVNGLSFNTRTRTFEPSALISVEDRLSGVNVYLNNELVANATPFLQRKVKAGYYQLRITKEHYYSYEKSFTLEENGVMAVRDIVFIAQDPLITNLDPEKTAKYSNPAQYDVGLKVVNGELYNYTSLVTRFSTNPVLVKRLNGGFIYQVGLELRLLLPAYSLDVLVYTLPGEGLAKINLRANDWQIIIYEENTVKQIDLLKTSESLVTTE